jgi:predicted AAA+ superfamily ATPase
VVTEFVKHKRNRLGMEELYFWRDSAGHEVDHVVEGPAGLGLVEIKSGRTVAEDWQRGVERLRRLAGGGRGIVVYGGDDDRPAAEVQVFGWRSVGQALRALAP